MPYMNAPNFKGNYPLAGERMGPLWRALWEALGDGACVSGADLAERFAQPYGVTPGTVRTLLWNAVKYGHLEQSFRNVVSGRNTTSGARRVYYRRTPPKEN